MRRIKIQIDKLEELECVYNALENAIAMIEKSMAMDMCNGKLSIATYKSLRDEVKDEIVRLRELASIDLNDCGDACKL